MPRAAAIGSTSETASTTIGETSAGSIGRADSGASARASRSSCAISTLLRAIAASQFLKSLLVAGDDMRLQIVRLQLQRGERRAQFVGGIGNELAFGFDRAARAARSCG